MFWTKLPGDIGRCHHRGHKHHFHHNCHYRKRHTRTSSEVIIAYKTILSVKPTNRSVKKKKDRNKQYNRVYWRTLKKIYNYVSFHMFLLSIFYHFLTINMIKSSLWTVVVIRCSAFRNNLISCYFYVNYIMPLPSSYDGRFLDQQPVMSKIKSSLATNNHCDLNWKIIERKRKVNSLLFIQTKLLTVHFHLICNISIIVRI